ncbi:MAG: 50S ribosomal protein L21 [Candidatus Gracilibacteria bacterium]|jgi:large subunit ribosomal protein L21
MFAIVEISGTQFKVEKGNKLEINRLKESKIGENVEFNRVLLLDDNGKLSFGNPFIEGACVKAKVLDVKRGDKVIVYKMKSKKRYRKTQGHRQELCTIEITNVSASGAAVSPYENAKKIGDVKEKTARPKKAAAKKVATTKKPRVKKEATK